MSDYLHNKSGCFSQRINLLNVENPKELQAEGLITAEYGL
jgi:hypothetical protein